MIYPDCDMKRWECCDTSVILANADYYYTKEQVDDIVEDIEGVDEEEVQDMIDRSIRNKADKSEVAAVDAKVNNTYTKQEVNSLVQNFLSKMEANSMFADYSKVEGKTLVLNSNNII